MATLVLTAVGTALGGPLGGAIGAFVGRQADNLIVGGGAREGPRVKELSVTTSSYGQPIPRNFGRMRAAGTVIWSTDLKESTSTEGGGKGRPSTKTYSYSASFAVALSSTPIDRLGRVWADGNLLRGSAGDLKTSGEMRVYLGTGDHAPDPAIAADKGALTPAFRDCAYVVFENLQLADFGNRIPALSFEVFSNPETTVSLNDLVPGNLVGLNESKLDAALGFSDEGGPIGLTLTAIEQVFPLTCVTRTDGLKLSSTLSLPEVIPTLPMQLSDRNSENAEEHHTQRGQTSDSEPLALRYYDDERDYQPGVQRAVGLRPEGRERMLDLPATMNAQGARWLANSNAHRARWRNERKVWKIGELDPEIGPGSIVRIPGSSGNWRVDSWEWHDRGIELTLDRLAPNINDTVNGDAGIANRPPDLLTTTTLLSAFEAPPADATNSNSPTILAAVGSSGPGWRGAALYVEEAGTLSSIGVSGRSRAVTALLAAPLGPSPGLIFEPNASVQLDLAADDQALDSSDMTGLAMGANRLMVGAEVLQFLSAEQISQTRWELRGLLRGRGGTEDAALQGHTAGTSAVLIDERLTAIDASSVFPNPGTRFAAIGTADVEPVLAELQNPGLSRRPPTPVSPSRTTNQDGSWELCWTRRARGHWRWPENGEVPIVEERESYEVGLGSCDEPLALWTTSSSNFVLSSAERADLLAVHGPSELWVRQIGTYGRSNALLLTSINDR